MLALTAGADDNADDFKPRSAGVEATFAADVSDQRCRALASFPLHQLS